MNTINRSGLSSRSIITNITFAMLGAFALSSVVACAAPTESSEAGEATVKTEQTSQALNDNGTGSDGSTCDSRQQSCYITCGAIYGGESDETHREQCENLCDEIHNECSPARTIGTQRAVIVGGSRAFAR